MNTQKFYEIYDYIYTPFYKTKIFIFTTIALSIILLGVISYLIIKKYRKKVSQEKKLAPWELALKELQKLSPDSYETKDEFKKFYFTITSIIKNYLEKRFELEITNKTDEEAILYLKNKKLNTQNINQEMPEIIKQLETVFQGALFIKFANAQVLREQAHKDLKTIVSIIEKTKNQPTKTL